MRKSIVLSGLCLLMLPMVALSATLEQRIKQLEETIQLQQEEAAEAERKEEEKFQISGYTDLEYHSSSKSGDNPGFRLHHFSLFFKKKIAPKWKFFAEIEYEDAPKFEGTGPSEPIDAFDGKIYAEAVNVDYLADEKYSFRFGRYFTPAGIWSEDHYPPFVPTQERPAHVRKIFPQVVDGVMVYGTTPIGKSFFKYNLYLGNGEGNTAKKDANSEKATGLKVSFLFPWLKHFEVGGTVYQDVLNADVPPGLNSRTDKSAMGAHLKLKAGDFSFQTEYAKAEIEPDVDPDYEQTGYYAQLLYNVSSKWLLGVRHDVFDDESSADGEKETNSVFINYRVSKDIVLKLEQHAIDYENPATEDYDKTIASVVINLGN